MSLPQEPHRFHARFNSDSTPDRGSSEEISVTPNSIRGRSFAPKQPTGVYSNKKLLQRSTIKPEIIETGKRGHIKPNRIGADSSIVTTQVSVILRAGLT